MKLEVQSKIQMVVASTHFKKIVQTDSNKENLLKPSTFGQE